MGKKIRVGRVIKMESLVPNAPKKDLDDPKCPTPSSTIMIITTKHIWGESSLSGESKQSTLGQFDDIQK